MTIGFVRYICEVPGRLWRCNIWTNQQASAIDRSWSWTTLHSSPWYMISFPLKVLGYAVSGFDSAYSRCSFVIIYRFSALHVEPDVLLSVKHIRSVKGIMFWMGLNSRIEIECPHLRSILNWLTWSDSIHWTAYSQNCFTMAMLAWRLSSPFPDMLRCPESINHHIQTE
jgi:hypothetical protein